MKITLSSPWRLSTVRRMSLRSAASPVAIVALLLATAPASPSYARAEAVQTNSVLGTYLAAHLAEQLRDNEAADSLLKIALERDPNNPSLLSQAFITETTAGNWTKAVAYATRAVAANPSDQLAHLVLGVDAFKAGRLGDADKHFSVSSNNAAAVIARAWVLTARKDSKGAAALLASISEPNWVNFFRRLQGALMADVSGDSAEAGKVYEDLFAANHGAPDVALDYAHHASHLGDNKLAADILAKHVAVVPMPHPLIVAAIEAVGKNAMLPLEISTPSEGLAETFYGFSQALEGQGGVDLALVYNQLALQLAPDDQLLQFSLAQILEQLKKYDEAIATYKKLPADSPLHFDASLRMALNFNALDKLDEAKTALLALADPVKSPSRPVPSRSELHAQIDGLAGVSLHEKGDKIVTLQKLLAEAGLGDGGGNGIFGPDTKAAMMKLQKDAGLPVSGAFTPATRKALEERIAALPQQASPQLGKEELIDLYTTLGNMERGRKQFADAASDYGKAIALIDKPAKANWDQYYSRAVCFERMNQWDKAEPDFLKAMELNPDEPLILNYLGYSWVDRDQHIDKALELIKKAVSLKPDDGYYVDSLGWAYFRMGRFDDAVAQLEHAVELNAGDPTINDHLGDAYWRDGRRLEAQFQWSTALTYKPEPEDVPKIEEKLKHGLAQDPAAATAAVTPKAATDSGTGATKQP